MLQNNCLDVLVKNVLLDLAGLDDEYAQAFSEYIKELGIAPPMEISAAMDHFYLSAAIGCRIQDSVKSTEYWRINDGTLDCYHFGESQGKGWGWLRKRGKQVLDIISGKPGETRAYRNARDVIQQIMFAENGGEILVVTNLPALGLLSSVIYSTTERNRGGDERQLVQEMLCLTC